MTDEIASDVTHILKNFEDAPPRLNNLLLKHLVWQRDKFHCKPKSEKLLICSRKFMAVKVIVGFIKQGYAISKETNSAFDFASWLNRYMPYPSLMDTHSLLNYSQCIDSTLSSNYCPFNDADIPKTLWLL